MSFPNSLKLLEDPNIWIADMGATCDTTPHKVGANNIKKPTKEDAVTFGDGTNNTAKAIFDVSGVMTNKYGNTIWELKLQNVMYVPTAAYNMVSLTARLKDGWKLNGEDEKIWIAKGHDKVVFDICIETKWGLVFAINIKQNKQLDELSAVGPDGETKPPRQKKLSIQHAHDCLVMWMRKPVERHVRHLGGN
jgi:hypothetical protein